MDYNRWIEYVYVRDHPSEQLPPRTDNPSAPAGKFIKYMLLTLSKINSIVFAGTDAGVFLLLLFMYGTLQYSHDSHNIFHTP